MTKGSTMFERHANIRAFDLHQYHIFVFGDRVIDMTSFDVSFGEVVANQTWENKSKVCFFGGGTHNIGNKIAKRGLAMDVLKYFPELEDVEFLEIVKRS